MKMQNNIFLSLYRPTFFPTEDVDLRLVLYYNKTTISQGKVSLQNIMIYKTETFVTLETLADIAFSPQVSLHSCSLGFDCVT